MVLSTVQYVRSHENVCSQMLVFTPCSLFSIFLTTKGKHLQVAEWPFSTVIGDTVQLRQLGHTLLKRLEDHGIVLWVSHLFHPDYQASLRVDQHEPAIELLLDDPILSCPASGQREKEPANRIWLLSFRVHPLRH